LPTSPSEASQRNENHRIDCNDGHEGILPGHQVIKRAIVANYQIYDTFCAVVLCFVTAAMLSINSTCNSTLDDLRLKSEIPIAGKLTFHALALIISAACSLVAIVLSLFLIWMHATHYTKPCEQRQYVLAPPKDPLLR
jgi:hypothetical protein